MATPPTTSQRVRCSPSSTSAKRRRTRAACSRTARPVTARRGDRREPEEVRQEERPDHGEREADPHQRSKWKFWLAVCGIRRPRSGPTRGEHERADPKGRVAAHQRRDPPSSRPTSRGGDREAVADDVAREPARAGGDERDADHRDDGRHPESVPHALEPDHVVIRPMKIGVVPRTASRSPPTSCRPRRRSRAG